MSRELISQTDVWKRLIKDLKKTNENFKQGIEKLKKALSDE